MRTIFTHFHNIFAASCLALMLIVFGAGLSSCGSSRGAAKTKRVITAVASTAKTSGEKTTGGKSTGSGSGSKSTSSASSQIKIDSSLPAETKALLAEASKWIGTAYKYGGDTRSGVDCSGLMINLYRNAVNIKLPRSSSQQQQYCSRISKNDLVEGDLVFFSTGSGSKVSHVGMYIGDGRMVHSSTSRGVIVSALNEAYYQRTFHSAGRVDSYYAMINTKGKKKQSKDKTPEETPELPISVGSEPADILIAGTGTTKGESVGNVIRQAVRPIIKNTIKETVRTKVATPPPATRKAIETTRRLLLDEAINQKVDSIVSEYFD